MAGELILVADDSATVAEMLEALLTGEGYQVIVATDGTQAAERAFSRRPDLVLLDVAMPHMNGYQVCRLLKSDPSLRDTPVLLLTSKDQVADKFWGVQSGADRYLTKECGPDEILAVVRDALAKRPLPTPGARPAASAQTQPLDLLSRVNDLLDRRLFQATILNEIARLARSLQDLDQCAGAVMKILSQLVDYDLLGILLSEGERGEFYVRQAKPVTRSCLDRFEKDCFNALAAQVQEAPARDQWRVSVSDDSQAGESADDLPQLIALPLESEARTVGLLAFAGRSQVAVAQEDQRLLSSLADQVSVVLDNARLYRKVRVMAVSDELTGLANLRHLREHLAEEFARARRYGSDMSLIMLDIDHFKAVNDRCGHQTGNLVLTQVVSVIRAQIRERIDVAARYGGEEFAIILPMTGLAGAVEVAERLRRAVSDARFGLEDDPLRLTVSLGVVSFPAVIVPAADDLITAADDALYAAKEGGRNSVRYTGELPHERYDSRTDSAAV